MHVKLTRFAGELEPGLPSASGFRVRGSGFGVQIVVAIVVAIVVEWIVVSIVVAIFFRQ